MWVGEGAVATSTSRKFEFWFKTGHDGMMYSLKTWFLWSFHVSFFFFFFFFQHILYIRPHYFDSIVFGLLSYPWTSYFYAPGSDSGDVLFLPSLCWFVCWTTLTLVISF